MEKLRFEFVMKAAADKKSNALMVTFYYNARRRNFRHPGRIAGVDTGTEKTEVKSVPCIKIDSGNSRRFMKKE
ncbi:unnamed protein product, partial [Trichogramma brassicae]